mmetsp:Transcript_147251/g.257235  ORF Transcript_147251/g.257235 Transcript_147251/m.257235 type:complete len:123 (-) Transcript_147251:80-448(-)
MFQDWYFLPPCHLPKLELKNTKREIQTNFDILHNQSTGNFIITVTATATTTATATASATEQGTLSVSPFTSSGLPAQSPSVTPQVSLSDTYPDHPINWNPKLYTFLVPTLGHSLSEEMRPTF